MPSAHLNASTQWLTWNGASRFHHNTRNEAESRARIAYTTMGLFLWAACITNVGSEMSNNSMMAWPQKPWLNKARRLAFGIRRWGCDSLLVQDRTATTQQHCSYNRKQLPTAQNKGHQLRHHCQRRQCRHIKHFCFSTIASLRGTP